MDSLPPPMTCDDNYQQPFYYLALTFYLICFSRCPLVDANYQIPALLSRSARCFPAKEPVLPSYTIMDKIDTIMDKSLDQIEV